LDFFLLTTMERDAAGRLLPDQELIRRFAPPDGKLTEVPVKLLFDDPDINFQTRYACYTDNRLWCYGDGETGHRLEEDGKYHPHQCPCLRLENDYAGKDRCKPNGTLQVLLQGVDRIGGVWKFRTTSWNSVNSILSSMKLIQAITGGILAGIPLKLVLRPKTATMPDNGQQLVFFTVSLEFSGTEQELVQIAYDLAWQRAEHKARMDQIEAEARRALEQLAETPEEMREVQEEFYPEGVVLEANLPQSRTDNPEGKRKAPSTDTEKDSAPLPTEGFPKTQEGLGFNPLTPTELEMVPVTWEPPPGMIDVEPPHGVVALPLERDMSAGDEGNSKGQAAKPTSTKRRRRTGPKENLQPAPPPAENVSEDKTQLF
ncbi:MAG: hypothetical protein HY913_06580, partial [Desulfomonile tiedjei]|nr:hypothetical protein [Desulfomonile tiedjei]